MMEKDTRKKAKHGGHNPDSVLLGLHVSPEQKAVAKMAAMMLHTDVTTVMLDGLHAKSAALGITNARGKVTPAFREEIDILAQQVRCKKTERQNNGK